MAAMSLTSIRIRDEQEQSESLALALQAVARWGGLDIDYDSLCALLGLSFMTCSTTVRSMPGTLDMNPSTRSKASSIVAWAAAL